MSLGSESWICDKEDGHVLVRGAGSTYPRFLVKRVSSTISLTQFYQQIVKRIDGIYDTVWQNKTNTFFSPYNDPEETSTLPR